MLNRPQEEQKAKQKAIEKAKRLGRPVKIAPEDTPAFAHIVELLKKLHSVLKTANRKSLLHTDSIEPEENGDGENEAGDV